MQESEPRVAIIGGGFAGLVLALLLEKENIGSRIYEARPESYSRGRNIALAPNALRVLDHCGIYKHILSRGHNYEKVAFCNGAGKKLGDFLNGSEEIYGYPALRVSRKVVRDALLEAVREVGIEIVYEKRCIGILSEDDKKVKAQFEDGQELDTEYLIGADGIHSQIRPFIAPSSFPVFSGMLGIGGTVMAEDLNYTVDDYGLDLPCMLFGAAGPFAIMPANFEGTELGFFSTFVLRKRSRVEWEAFGADKGEQKRMLRGRFEGGQGWPRLVGELCEKTREEDLSCWPQFAVPKLSTWLSPKKRVIIIGDAAHAIPPTGGQGAAMAFEDAETLAYAFTFIFRDDPNTEYVLRSWEAHRIKRVQKVTDFTNRSSALRKPSSSRFERVVKEMVLRLFFKLKGPGSGQKWMYAYDGLKESYGSRVSSDSLGI